MTEFFVVGALWETCCDCGSDNISQVSREIGGVIISGGECMDCGAEHYQEDEFIRLLEEGKSGGGEKGEIPL